MEVRFVWLIFMSCFILDDFALSQFSFSQCLLDPPQKCDEESLSSNWPKTKSRFILFTRKSQKEPEALHMCNGTLPKYSRFNPTNPLVVIIPGFYSGTCDLASIAEIKDELLEKADMNVLLIINDEEYGNDFLTAMGNTDTVANVTVQVLRNIQAKTGFKNENVFLVGHSLGAHVAGLVGQQFPVHRITGLDPAGVMYSKDTPIGKRLDPSDAEIVDVVHTNGGTGLPYFGAYFPMGDVDIYVNGGADQPLCGLDMAWNAVKQFHFIYGLGYSVPTLCAHTQAIEYYKNSINNSQGKLIAYACSSYKKFKTGNCTRDEAFNITVGFDLEKSFTLKHRTKEFPRKYYIDTEKSWLLS